VTPPARANKGSVRNTVEWILIVGAALLAAFIIKTFLLQAFYIPSESMTPTLLIKDRVLVNKLSYRMHAIHRGDVVVFERPPAELGGDPAIKDLIKRVVGLPGETVEGKDGHVLVNGKAIAEPYLPKDTVTSTFPPTAVKPGQIWVMGDNRPNSKDSRFFGTISDDLVVGRAFIRVWPITNIGLL
jgi:signal peptidase I